MPAGRPIEFNPDAALDAAMQLFWRKGYESSSLHELITTMGLSKSSFYATFNSKHALFERCIEHYQQSLLDLLRARLEQAGNARQFINELFASVADETAGPHARRGCLLMNTASEFAQSDKEIASLVSASLESMVRVFEEAITLGQQQNNIPRDRDAHDLAIYLVSSMSGMKNMVKAGADRETVGRIARVVLAGLD